MTNEINPIILDGETSYIITTDSHTEVAPANGSDFSLEELQAAVNGYIEIVFHLAQNEDYIMVVNEEGHLYDLPYNAIASFLAGQNIVGDVLICPNGLVK